MGPNQTILRLVDLGKGADDEVARQRAALSEPFREHGPVGRFTLLVRK
jgi:hypothetical protein